MSDINFLILTAVAAVAFAFALLGVMTQWLKADEQASAMEPHVQRKLGDGATLGGPSVMQSSAAPALPTAPASESNASSEAQATPVDKAAAQAEEATAELESYIARHLLAWGGAATALGMLLGWFAASFSGALAGAAVGTVLGVLAGTAVAALKRKHQS